MDFDTVLSDIGECGKYQKMVLWFVLLPGVFPCGFHAYNQLFMAAKPDHWCRVPQLLESARNFSENYAKNLRSLQSVFRYMKPAELGLLMQCYFSIPYKILEDGSLKYSKCLMYDKDYDQDNLLTNSAFVNCKYGWSFDKSEFQNTVVTQFQLVCDKDFYSTLALVIFGVGGLIGNYIFGYVQDGMGRRPAFFIYLFIQSVFGIATAFARNFTMWTIFRVGVGFTVPAILGTPYVLAIELVGPRYRTYVIVLINIAYSLSLVSLAIIVWLIRDWRILALSTTVPFLLLFLDWSLLPESPRWLLAQGRISDADKILQKMAKVNGKKLHANYVIELKKKLDQEKEEKLKVKYKYGIRDLFRKKNLRWKTIIITFIWFTNTSVYVGLSYYAPALNGDEFLNFFLAGAVELPTYLFLWPALERWGRRWALCVSMIIGGSACLATFLVEHDSVVTLALYCIGKMGISSSFVVLPLMASELYPTVVRGLGMSLSSVVGMLGPIFIPLVNYLGTNILTLPLIIMGFMLVMGGISSLFLPETLNQVLPQTLEDGEEIKLDCLICCEPPRIEDEIEVTRRFASFQEIVD